MEEPAMTTLDLTVRQAARVIEQAVRGEAAMALEPRNRPIDSALLGRLIGREGPFLRFELRSGAAPLELIGVCCDVRLELSGQLYLFATNIVDIPDHGAQRELLIAPPDWVQVANRRRFERTNATIAAQVRIKLHPAGPTNVGLMSNISADGLACILPGLELDEHALVGEPAQLAFELPGFDDLFELPAELCNKARTDDQQQLILSFQFKLQPSDTQGRASLERVREALVEISHMLNTGGDA
jgi:hypothetical protein